MTPTPVGSTSTTSRGGSRPSLGRSRAGALILLVLGASGGSADSALSLADLAAYRAALTDRDRDASPTKAVTFSDLWRNPGAHQGRRVRVEGRFVRRFRQSAIGTFPPLAETWIAAPSGDLFCLVSPSSGAPSLSPKTPVRFVGTFLKTVRYQAGDVPRLAPLLVGPDPPRPTSPVTNRPVAPPGFSSLDWSIGIGAGVFVVLVLLWNHVRRPIRRSTGHDLIPRPSFVPSLPPSESAAESHQDAPGRSPTANESPCEI